MNSSILLTLLLFSAALVPRTLGSIASDDRDREIDVVLAELRSSEDRYIEELKTLVSFPSISSSPERLPDLLKAADWLLTRLSKAGLRNVQLLNNPEGPRPAVYGDFIVSPDLPTVLIYAHYDVQPADPEAAWTSPPFSPEVRDGALFGRGASDDKGGLLGAVQAVEALLRVQNTLPLNVKFLLEGEEEILSPGLDAFLSQHSDILEADVALSADGEQGGPNQPGIVLGLRGAAALEVEVATLARDVHSGMVGGAVQNANRALAQLINSMFDPETNKVLVEGFYDSVRTMTAQDRGDLLALNYDEQVSLVDALGAVAPIGEAGYSSLERIWLRPTLEIVGMYGGFSGEGLKTVIPAKATAKLAARLVPDQTPDEILKLVERHIEKYHPPGCNVTVRELGAKAAPYVTDREGPVVAAAARVLKRIMDAEPMYLKRGATIPALAAFQKHLGIETTLFGFGLPDDAIHAPDERYRLSQYAMGREAYVRILMELGADAAAGKLVFKTKKKGSGGGGGGSDRTEL